MRTAAFSSFLDTSHEAIKSHPHRPPYLYTDFNTMATNELEGQPVVDSATEELLDNPSDDTFPADDAIPEHKSGVRIDPNALDQSGRFEKRDTVHMSMIQSGVRTKGTFKVAKGRLNKSKSYWEYQLEDGDGRPYKNGAWIREKDLKMEKRG
ncbi:uncharacterized protein BDR25DRAFT_75836 [Lindgomyces ingoldianus]|uniref:Uncharacterized protein n=1 Tax=Lindgomyces ingoldianus TaxID=673940 RepID=A0ACB6QHV0_9PLEO|nr:uncharacterized protein BDR25DRAFT_75836 [Lindgomyces ingoldianus]KAF2466509.1 hypothetical protein BDR25DRAFT_75836 [Lindgomyces ingoldianus]